MTSQPLTPEQVQEYADRYGITALAASHELLRAQRDEAARCGREWEQVTKMLCSRRDARAAAGEEAVKALVRIADPATDHTPHGPSLRRIARAAVEAYEEATGGTE
jgi:hypothetical protein